MRRYDLEQLGYCRSCLNEVYGLHLKRDNVQISYCMNHCKRCGKVKNIVVDVSSAKRVRLFMVRKDHVAGKAVV